MDRNGDWRSTHRGLSAEDLRYREIARSSPELLDRASFQALMRNRDLLQYRLQPWLTFVGPEKLAEFKRVSLGMFDLLVSLPQRVFGKDPAKLAEFYDLGSPVIAEILFSHPTGTDMLVSRGDFIDTEDGFKCIEFNFTPNLGGWETSILVGMHRDVPATAAVLEELGIEASYTDTMELLFRHLIAEDDRKGTSRGGELTLAFIVGDDDPVEEIAAGPVVVHLNQELARTLAAAQRGDLRGRVVACRYHDLVEAREGLYVGKLRVQAVLEFCEGRTPPHVYRAFKSGQISLLNGPMDSILSSKRNVALLSQLADSDLFDAGERAFIARHVPWTRLVVPGDVDFAGETVPLRDLLLSRQESFVLKDAASFGGKGVVLGRFTPVEEWRKALDRALANGRWVVQEHLESLPYLYQSGDHGCSIHDVIWGPFVFGGAYAGAILRMQPKADEGAVNLSLHATEGIILEVISS
jgi:hypothetical protein